MRDPGSVARKTPMAKGVSVAASRQSAAVFGFLLYWRRSSETPLRGDGPGGFFSAITGYDRPSRLLDGEESCAMVARPLEVT